MSDEPILTTAANGEAGDSAVGEVSVSLAGAEAADAPEGLLSEQQARLWTLVLEAKYIPCHLEQAGDYVRLMVPASYFDIAVAQVRLFEHENRNWPPPFTTVSPLIENTLATLSILLLLATFHNITRIDLLQLTGCQSPDWTALGNADAALIRGGEWWRLVTALTLHANTLHLVSNLAIGGFFVICLCRQLGSGLAWSLILGSGVLGNLLNSLLHSSDHRSVGASTAVFGTVGILAAVSMHRSGSSFRKHRILLPLAAALALLATLGTEGERVDLGAHLFGFVAGVGLGLGAEYLVRERGAPGRRLNFFLVLTALAVVVVSWREALKTVKFLC